METIVQNPRSSCALGGAVASVTNIYGAVPIIHSGPGCSMQAFMGQIGPAARNNSFIGSEAVPCTNMSQTDVIFGGVNHLNEVINGAIEVMEGDVYFVLSGCTADIIADDTEGVVEEFRRKGVPIVCVETGGFKGDSHRGYESVLSAIAGKLTLPLKAKQEKFVNLFGIVPSQELFWAGNIDEITRILNRIGIRVNSFFTKRQGIKEIQHSSEASANIILSPWLGREAEEIYKRKFGVRSLRFFGVPVGPTATSAFLRSVGKFLTLDSKLVEQVILEEENEVYDYLSTTAASMQHNHFAIVGDTNTVLGVCAFLANDYGQIPVAAIITDALSIQDKAGVQKQIKKLEFVAAPKLYFEQDQWEIQQILLKRKPDYILGSSLDFEVAQKLEVPLLKTSFPVTDKLVLNRSIVGYRGSLTLVEEYANKYS